MEGKLIALIAVFSPFVLMFLLCVLIEIVIMISSAVSYCFWSNNTPSSETGGEIV